MTRAFKSSILQFNLREKRKPQNIETWTFRQSSWGSNDTKKKKYVCDRVQKQLQQVTARNQETVWVILNSSCHRQEENKNLHLLLHYIVSCKNKPREMT